MSSCLNSYCICYLFHNWQYPIFSRKSYGASFTTRNDLQAPVRRLMISNTNASPEVREEDQVLTLEQFGIAEDLDDRNKSTSPSSNIPEDAPQHASLRVSRRKLYLMVLADFGLSFTWLCKFAVATPYFQHTLKAGPFLSHLVWIMGPLSGLIVAPVVGVLSDRCTSSFGRRRPFMLGGVVFCILGMLIFAKSPDLTFGYLPAARLLAIVAFGVLDFSTNAIMFPSRALLGDLLPADQQHPVQSAAAVVASLGEICAGAYLASWKDPVTNIVSIFTVASVLLAITSGVSLVVCKETPIGSENVVDGGSVEMVSMESPRERTAERSASIHDNMNAAADQGSSAQTLKSSEGEYDSETPVAAVGTIASEVREGGEAPEEVEDETDEAVEDRLSVQQMDCEDEESHVRGENTRQLSVWGELGETIKTTLMNFPRPLVRVGIVYGLAWFLWFASLPFYSQWLGVDVLQGDAQAEPGSGEALQYQRGVTVFSIANVAKAILAMVFSAFYPSIIKWVGAVGERVVFGMSFAIFSSVLFAFAYTTNVVVAACVIALGSVPFIVTQTIPIALVVQRYPEHLASNLGVLNLFCVVPQLVDTLYTGKIAEIASESAVLRVAACWGFAASVAAFCFL